MTPATEEKAARMLSGGHLKIHTASTDYIRALKLVTVWNLRWPG